MVISVAKAESLPAETKVKLMDYSAEDLKAGIVEGIRRWHNHNPERL